MLKTRFVLSVSLVFFSITSFAMPYLKLKAQPITLEEQGVRIHGYVYPGKANRPFSGTQILLTHGLSSNLHEFEHLIPELVEAGFTCYAFNFRGHGNGDEQSTVLQYKEGDYQLWHMAQTDFPLMVEHVIKMSGQKPHVLGHSMGGMVPRGAIVHNRVDQNHIQSLTLIGSPPHFRGKARALRAMNLFGFDKLLQPVVYSGSGNDRLSPIEDIKTAAENATNILDFINLLNPIYWTSKYIVNKMVLPATKKVVLVVSRIEMGPLDEEHALAWMNRAITHRLPKDILRSFDRFTQHGYPYEEVQIPVPTLHIMGKRDSLVAWKDIVQSGRQQSTENGHWFIRVNGIGHMGLVAPWVIDGYFESLLKFIDDPESLGPKNKTFLQFSPKKLELLNCDDLLPQAS